MQCLGIDIVAPCEFLLSIVSARSNGPPSPIDPDAAIAALPATLLGHVLPCLLMSTLHITATDVSRSRWNFKAHVCRAVFVSPMIVSSLTMAIFAGIKWLRRRHLLSPVPAEVGGSAQDDSSSSSGSAVKTAYAAMFTVQVSQHIFESCRLALSARQMWGSYCHVVLDQWKQNTPWGPIQNSPHFVLACSTIIFCLHTVWDLRRMGYITTREAGWAVLTFGLGLRTVGIGADYAGLWYWREGVLERAGHYSRPLPLGAGEHVESA